MLRVSQLPASEYLRANRCQQSGSVEELQNQAPALLLYILYLDFSKYVKVGTTH